jgi:FkbM family methyltransferase
VLCVTNFKRGGFFVEFGATNGIDINNTYLLETDFSWGGILAEPARIWHEPLRRNRRAAIDTRCVWSKSDEVVEFTQDGGDPERSGITSLTTAGTDGDRGSPQRYPVQTVSLNDLLSGHGSPTHVDYLSLDTEGSEHQILEAFDFCRYTVDIITVEHNHTPQRQLLHDLLQRRGFGRVYEHLSAVDDWYIRRDASFADLIPTTSLM